MNKNVRPKIFEVLKNRVENVCNSVCKFHSVYSASIDNIAHEDFENIKEKINIVGNGENREIKYQNWSRMKLLFKTWPSFSLPKVRVRRTSYNMLFLNQCLFERLNIYYLLRMDCDPEYFHLSVNSYSMFSKILPRYSDQASNSENVFPDLSTD